MTQPERKQKLLELREEYVNGTRSKLSIKLEGKALSKAIELYDKRHPASKLI